MLRSARPRTLCAALLTTLARLGTAAAARGEALLEIGTDRGSSALVLLGALADARITAPEAAMRAHLVTVDPWGGRRYPASDSRYGDDRQRLAMTTLAAKAAELANA